MVLQQPHTTSQSQRRVAFVDLLFCWPPNGGADVDLFHVIQGLSQSNVECCLFLLQLEGIPGRGQIQPEELPFSSRIIRLNPNRLHHDDVVRAMASAVETWKPTVVFLTHGYALKPFIAEALAQYPLIGRYYAHELTCARNSQRFMENAPCIHNYLIHPDPCRRCAFQHTGPEIKQGRYQAWTQEYLIAKAYQPDYYTHVRHALDCMKYIVVSNSQLLRDLDIYASKGMVIPGGIAHTEGAPFQRPPSSIKTIFMAGRVEDPSKGLSVLRKARDLLATRRSDFHIQITHPDPVFKEAHLSSTGWLSHEDTLQCYQHADICVVPSLWHEPFGLVALEAMAAGLPVCASRIGGLQDIVVHEKTGFLFSPGDAAALADYLERLLEDASLRHSMGQSGLARVKQEYTWDVIIRKHYLPLLESL